MVGAGAGCRGWVRGPNALARPGRRQGGAGRTESSTSAGRVRARLPRGGQVTAPAPLAWLKRSETRQRTATSRTRQPGAGLLGGDDIQTQSAAARRFLCLGSPAHNLLPRRSGLAAARLAMEEEDLSERGLTIASIMNRVRDLKNKYKNEDNVTDELNFTKVSADTTDNSGTVNQIMMTANNPEDWLSFLLKLEKKGIPQTDISLLNRLIGRYSQAVAALPAEKHSQNENYARILVRFAELKAFQDPEEARDQFHLARLNCKKFAFVHVALAQFELSQ
ncbi:hypothetical protein KIL84_016364, partial [Mauremys mutica]